jgi:hypothetical protein
VTNAEKEGPRQSLVEIDGEVVPFSIREGLLRREKELTAAEKKERERFSWNRGPVYVYSPAGSLAFEVHLPSGKGARMRWSDGKKQRLEDHLARIVEAIFLFGERLKDERRVAEERRRRRGEWENERAEKLRLIHEEEQRLKKLFAEVDAWHRSRRLRAYIRDVVQRIESAQGPAQPGSSLQKWADWATVHADRLDPLVKAPPSILDEKSKWEHSYGPY